MSRSKVKITRDKKRKKCVILSRVFLLCGAVVRQFYARSNVKLKGQRSRSPGTKKESSGVVVFGVVVLRQFYAGGKIIACCP